MTDRTITCEQFDAILPELLEGTLGERDRAEAEAHRRDCARCAMLATELTAIAQGAAALPRLSPSRDLWAGIAARIDTPVVAIGAEPASPAAAARPTPAARRAAARWATPWRLGAAAAALVLLTVGVTYRVTMRLRDDAGRVAVVPAPAAPTEAATGSAPESTVAPLPGAGTEREVASGSPSPSLSPSSSPSRVQSVSRRAEPSPLEVYDREIAGLRRILQERGTVLDPTTAAILESNLSVIDRAIAESRAALRRDPASRFLEEQLDRALNKKVELLRTAALLPAST